MYLGRCTGQMASLIISWVKFAKLGLQLKTSNVDFSTHLKEIFKVQILTNNHKLLILYMGFMYENCYCMGVHV
jgi:flagellar biosynthesis protein FlhB